MTKSRIQKERERKRLDFMADYERFMSEEGAVQLRVFEKLAEIYGYSNGNTAAVTFHRWKKELKTAE